MWGAGGAGQNAGRRAGKVPAQRCEAGPWSGGVDQAQALLRHEGGKLSSVSTMTCFSQTAACKPGRKHCDNRLLRAALLLPTCLYRPHTCTWCRLLYWNVHQAVFSSLMRAWASSTTPGANRRHGRTQNPYPGPSLSRAFLTGACCAGNDCDPGQKGRSHALQCMVLPLVHSCVPQVSGPLRWPNAQGDWTASCCCGSMSRCGPELSCTAEFRSISSHV